MRTRNLSLEELAALANPSARQPDAVVVDLRGGRPLPASVAALRKSHPATGVLIVASSLDPAVMLEAMRAGVTECVPEPLAAADLEAAITQARQPDASPRQAAWCSRSSAPRAASGQRRRP